MLHTLPDATLTALVGAGGGVLLGLAARLGRFCTLGAIEDHLYQSSDTRLRMWLLAIATAGVLVFGLSLAGLFDPRSTFHYLSPFSPLAHILGGLMFGYGMALAGNCGFGALARTGGGDLRAFVIVLVMGVSAYVMVSGPFAHLRVSLIDSTTLAMAARNYPELITGLLPLSANSVGLALAGALALYAVCSPSLRHDLASLMWAIIVGLAIAAGWVGTYTVAQNGFGVEPVISHTFTAPLGESLLYLMTSSGGGMSFGVGSVAGVLLGAFIGSLIKGHFRWEACEDPRELKRQLIGATLMGFGAVLALGCTIGQGISAFAIFSLGAPLTFAAIYLGAALGLRQLITGFGRMQP